MRVGDQANAHAAAFRERLRAVGILGSHRRRSPSTAPDYRRCARRRRCLERVRGPKQSEDRAMLVLERREAAARALSPRGQQVAALRGGGGKRRVDVLDLEVRDQARGQVLLAAPNAHHRLAVDINQRVGGAAARFGDPASRDQQRVVEGRGVIGRSGLQLRSRHRARLAPRGSPHGGPTHGRSVQAPRP